MVIDPTCLTSSPDVDDNDLLADLLTSRPEVDDSAILVLSVVTMAADADDPSDLFSPPVEDDMSPEVDDSAMLVSSTEVWLASPSMRERPTRPPDVGLAVAKEGLWLSWREHLICRVSVTGGCT